MKHKDKILFRLDADAKTGLGHFMRCKVLADVFYRSYQLQPIFVCRSMNNPAALGTYPLFEITSENELLPLARQAVAVVVDHYDYDSESLKKLSSHCRLLVVFDDENNRGRLYADIIINTADVALSMDYHKQQPGSELLLGYSYALLREQFLSLPGIGQKKYLLVTMGGSDPRQLTYPVLKLIVAMGLHRQFPVLVVTGRDCPQIGKIRAFCRKNGICHKHHVKNMARLFHSARFAIAAAGSTLTELAYCAVPFVMLVVADNQLPAANLLAKKLRLPLLDARSKFKPDFLRQILQKYLFAPNLGVISRKLHYLIDGMGSRRLSEQIIRKL